MIIMIIPIKMAIYMGFPIFRHTHTVRAFCLDSRYETDDNNQDMAPVWTMAHIH